LLKWLPGTSPLEETGGWPVWTQLILPVTVLTLYDAGYVARIVRSSMAEVMAMPYIRTAVLKGLTRRTVILRHAVRKTEGTEPSSRAEPTTDDLDRFLRPAPPGH